MMTPGANSHRPARTLAIIAERLLPVIDVRICWLANFFLTPTLCITAALGKGSALGLVWFLYDTFFVVAFNQPGFAFSC
ncbi:MAG: hypothetical protein JNM42_08615 [Propionivibrio sp.]|uniref:hypothetical protein n=1 Tax=Propionivibrio sp. TaxID=2212460 RepID=UPI001A4E6FAA|nr:hypothetical protein [Propionivibrio sp.]MBL8414484.1 hypothetical protein [Propionivibrio sp.]